jgi:ligand-binding SRPBCC domain-containing protein
MTSQITAYEHPQRFVDEQVHGPFATWWHEHTFTALKSGDTLMIGVVGYRAPFGPLGTMAERFALNTYMTNLLRRRNNWLKNQLEDARAS